MEAILRTENLSKIYGKGDNEVRAVDDVTLTVSRGEFVAIVGKSGSGKSTLLHLLGGLDYPTSGKVFVKDQDIFTLKDDSLAIFRRRKLGFIFQAFNLVSSINVWENIVLPIGLENSSLKRAAQKVDEDFVKDIISTLGLEKKIHNLPNTLSGGQQQRVAIARALASKPDVIFADEPTGNLDSKMGAEVLGLMQASARKYGQTLVVVSHDEDIAQNADRIIVMEDGIVKRYGY